MFMIWVLGHLHGSQRLTAIVDFQWWQFHWHYQQSWEHDHVCDHSCQHRGQCSAGHPSWPPWCTGAPLSAGRGAPWSRWSVLSTLPLPSGLCRVCVNFKEHAETIIFATKYYLTVCQWWRMLGGTRWPRWWWWGRRPAARGAGDSIGICHAAASFVSRCREPEGRIHSSSVQQSP